MKIRIDLQGVQTESRHRGIGRYSLALTKAVLDLAPPAHDIHLMFNAALGGVDECVRALEGSNGRYRREMFGPIRRTSASNPANDARRVAGELAFGYALEEGDPSVIWLSSVIEGFAEDALLPHATLRPPVVATLYDLIPLHDPSYMGRARSKDWYLARLEMLKRADLLLAISDWVRTDAIERLGIEPSRIVTIGAGVDSRFSPEAEGHGGAAARVRDAYGIDRSYVMYSGGFDKRKNVLRLLEAYASLSVELRATHALVLVGHMDSEMVRQIRSLARRHGLGRDEVLLTGFVSDAAMTDLYRACALFVFPSEQEGFGLPPLEAMACGAPVIVNNRSSLPEVVGDKEALVDVVVPGALCRKISAVLTDHPLADRLRVTGLQRSAHFTWQAAAARALTAIEGISTSPPRAIRPSNRENVLTAIVATPSPPAWLAQLAERRPVAIQGEDDPLPASDRLIYLVDGQSVERMAARIRAQPGVALLTGTLEGAPAMSRRDRFRLDGFASINEPQTGDEWVRLLREGAVDIRMEERDADVDLAQLDAWIDHTFEAAPLARQLTVEERVATGPGPRLDVNDLARMAYAITRVRTPIAAPRWLIDVSQISVADIGTGVHRLVRSILKEWLRRPPTGVRIEPVAFRDGRYWHAYAYAFALLGEDAEGIQDTLVDPRHSDTFVGLDWTAESFAATELLLRTWRRLGMSMHFVVNDILPVSMPHAFHPFAVHRFERWLRGIVSMADALHCISGSTALEVAAWIDAQRIGFQFGKPPVIDSFPLGVDPPAMLKTGTLPPSLANAMSARPSFLMVGTLEPRKGHAQALDAMELLWAHGLEVNLVLVGHEGWLVQPLIERLTSHTERGARLFWLDDADDATLDAAYAAATALLAPSFGEGFGLPLIEAAFRSKPVIARSLPVFREVAGDYPSYFDATTPEGLAKHLGVWLVERPESGHHQAWPDWAKSANALDALIRFTQQADHLAGGRQEQP